MVPIPVRLIDSGIDWSAIEAIGAVAAIIVAIVLPFVERWWKGRDELRLQLSALRAIGGHCVSNLERLDTRARTRRFAPDELGWLMDEAEALEALVGSVDLMSLRTPELVRLVAELQEAARTGRRRLGYGSKTIRNGHQLKEDHFEPPLKKAQNALKKLELIR